MSDEEPMPSVCGLKPGLFQALLKRVSLQELKEGDYSTLVFLMGLAMGQEQRIEAQKSRIAELQEAAVFGRRRGE